MSCQNASSATRGLPDPLLECGDNRLAPLLRRKTNELLVKCFKMKRNIKKKKKHQRKIHGIHGTCDLSPEAWRCCGGSLGKTRRHQEAPAVESQVPLPKQLSGARSTCHQRPPTRHVWQLLWRSGGLLLLPQNISKLPICCSKYVQNERKEEHSYMIFYDLVMILYERDLGLLCQQGGPTFF